MQEIEIRNRIIEALKQNPRGMTILEISASVDLSRVTVSKYVYGLMIEDIIHQRAIGPAKLCCLNPNYLELQKMYKDKEPEIELVE